SHRLLLASLTAGAAFLALGAVAARAQLQVKAQSRSTSSTLAPFCADTLRDSDNPAACLEASSIAQAGKLVPMSSDLLRLVQTVKVSAVNGNVGIGTTFPFRPLEVKGAISSSNGNGLIHVVMRP